MCVCSLRDHAAGDSLLTDTMLMKMRVEMGLSSEGKYRGAGRDWTVMSGSNKELLVFWSF